MIHIDVERARLLVGRGLVTHFIRASSGFTKWVKGKWEVADLDLFFQGYGEPSAWEVVKAVDFQGKDILEVNDMLEWMLCNHFEMDKEHG